MEPQSTQTASVAFWMCFSASLFHSFSLCFLNFVLSMLKHSRGGITEFFFASPLWGNYTDSCNFGEVCVEDASAL